MGKTPGKFPPSKLNNLNDEGFCSFGIDPKLSRFDAAAASAAPGVSISSTYSENAYIKWVFDSNYFSETRFEPVI